MEGDGWHAAGYQSQRKTTLSTMLRGKRPDGRYVLISLAAVIALIVGITLITSYQSQKHRTVTVCSKEPVSTGDGHEYRIYTDGGTFVMKDIYIGGTRFNTADAYGKIRPDTTYDLTYKGWRLPLFSTFPNIIEADVHQGNDHESGC
jgi:hypothetical protein